MIGELSEVGGRVGHGLVLAWFESYVLRLVFLDSSLQSPGQEKHFGILFIPLRVVVREYVCRDDNGGNQWPTKHAWFSTFFFCSSPGILRHPQHLARERETFWYHFCPCMPYGSRVSLTGEEEEEEEERKKEDDDFRFFQNSFSRFL